jgi:hypothetical protein
MLVHKLEINLDCNSIAQFDPNPTMFTPVYPGHYSVTFASDDSRASESCGKSVVVFMNGSTDQIKLRDK